MNKVMSLMMAVVMLIGLASCKIGAGSNKNGEISVLYYTYSDTYISSVRSAMDKLLTGFSVNYNDYDANGNQTTQTEQVHNAISKGSSMLIVNLVDTGSKDAAQNIVNLAKEKKIPVIFFNHSVDESVVSSYDKCVFVGTDFEMAGHMQGKMIGEYLVANYDKLDLNKDGKISYVMFKGQDGNMEAIARTQFGVEDANAVLKTAGKPDLSFYDSSNKKLYLVDQDGLWSSAAATNYMSTILAQYTEANNNMVELVIANNDEMALGAISALQSAGYNSGTGKAIPVFGVDATDAAKSAINSGSMTGTIKQDAQGMATAISTIMNNLKVGADTFKDIASSNVVGSWRVNIPYTAFTGE